MENAPTHTEQDVRQFRQDIDSLVQRLTTVFSPSRELAIVRTKLQEAKMWAGQELSNIGVELPVQYQDKAQLEAQANAPAQPEVPQAAQAPEAPAAPLQPIQPVQVEPVVSQQPAPAIYPTADPQQPQPTA
jgi:type IV secretory pathway VirB10-like protein